EIPVERVRAHGRHPADLDARGIGVRRARTVAPVVGCLAARTERADAVEERAGLRRGGGEFMTAFGLHEAATFVHAGAVGVERQREHRARAETGCGLER